MPGHVCPHPGPSRAGPGCPLWDARERIQFQRRVEADAAACLSLGVLVWRDLCRETRRPSSLPTRPMPVSPKPVTSLTSGPTPVTVAAPDTAKQPAQKGAPHA